jgi:hypothetical protein
MPLWTTTRVPEPSRWVGVSSVGRPVASVADAEGAVERASAMTVSRLRSLPGRRRAAVGASGYGDAGGVVAAVFEAAQAFNDDGDDGLGHVTDDST